jgi:hypothetical protein
MISDSPEFLEAMVKLNHTILENVVRERRMSQPEAELRKNAFEQMRKSIFPSSDFDARNKRLRSVLGLADESGDDSEEDAVSTYTVSILFG